MSRAELKKNATLAVATRMTRRSSGCYSGYPDNVVMTLGTHAEQMFIVSDAGGGWIFEHWVAGSLVAAVRC